MRWRELTGQRDPDAGVDGLLRDFGREAGPADDDFVLPAATNDDATSNESFLFLTLWLWVASWSWAVTW